MVKMIEVVIDSVRVSLTNQQRIVVLRQVDADRYLPIWIGAYEAEAITIGLQEVEVSRPQTHDLLKNLIKAMNGRLLRVEILALREDVFYGNLVIEQDGQTINVDSRPSDALALASRLRVPILIAKDVMDAASITPETNMTEEEEGTSQPAEAGESSQNESEERLSVFEDFLSNLDLGKLDDTEDNPPSDEDSDDKPNPTP
ncbi:MAG: bifunctional nuclease family protein [Anaerolineaceae bacterium]